MRTINSCNKNSENDYYTIGIQLVTVDKDESDLLVYYFTMIDQ